ncbi:MAG: porin [Planctomycetia bacterium]|nr:porin [Planctomycetia bacterium]
MKEVCTRTAPGGRRRLPAARRSCGITRGALAAAVAIALVLSHEAAAQGPAVDPRDKRIDSLENTVRQLVAEIERIKSDRAQERLSKAQHDKLLSDLSAEIDKLGASKLFDAESWVNKFTIGGYGEMHANLSTGNDPEQFDIHRLVLYLGYDFNDWIKLHSEIELEHAFVSSSSGGELSIEQLYVDFLLWKRLNVRAGRILTPLGIINKKHEPPTFYGVERPSFAKYIIPTTWSSDGIGIFGALTRRLKYEAYLVGGLDGSMFTATDGIRKGRIKERASLHAPAFTGRIDYHPLRGRRPSHGQKLRLGLSTYIGGLNNGNEGKDPGFGGKIHIYSADFEYSISRWDFRGAVAHETIDGARKLGGGTASEIFGWYLEGGYHFWKDKWKKGKLAKADAVVFLRYDDFDTQYKMPSGVAKDPAGDRSEVTLGLNFYPMPNFVIKADYQIRDGLSNLFNLGIGWEF